MTVQPEKGCGRFVRRHAAALALLAAIPVTGGCVSAVDESSAFGFAAAPQTPADGGSEQTPATKTADADKAATPETLGDAKPATTAEMPATEEESVESEGREIAASGRTSVAAYADGTVSGPDNATGERDTLFTSLFARSKPRTPLANAETTKSRRVILKHDGAPVSAGGDALPGVDPSSLFEIGQRASANDEDAIEDMATYQVASLSGMARLAPNGLLAQREDVETKCFDSQLVGMLRAIERQFRTKVVVTSGYRSPTHNRRVNGARHSQHMACKAADIIVPKANNQDVAAFVRALPGRGGVGTYCHTAAIHVDTGPQRDWNWQCRRRGGG